MKFMDTKTGTGKSETDELLPSELDHFDIIWRA